ncbi:MAG: SDR family NAD(P)-dependent oxidoreductase [Bacteroidales bacterium]|jgi:short-subunit dehydrogenase|nr:SDR family NAD(P)-dependent oxidoreductase [Bacteroidales bacterium]
MNKKVDDLDKNIQNVWITGASSGIGEELAYLFSQQNYHLILTARRLEELERVKNGCKDPSRCSIFKMDLSDSEQIKEIADQVLSTFGSVDILIHNGGISQRSLIAETPIEIDRLLMEVDYFGSVILTKKLLPSMLYRHKGHIVAISSIVSMFGFPQRAAYSAAKHAMNAFYETLWAENQADGIRTTIVYPGRIITRVSYNAITKDGTAHGVMDNAQQKGIPATLCAKKIKKGIDKNKRQIYICQNDIWMVRIKRFFPLLYYKIVSKIKPNG